MKGSLLLPIDSRKSSLIQIPKLDTDPPVGITPSVPLSVEVPDCSDSKEIILERDINHAVTNAELNQRLTSSFRSVESLSVSNGHARRSSVSVRFGNESDVEYDEDGDLRVFQTTVRSSKEFDGNRSGRRSAKQ
jgi:hypothetical protein